VLAPAQRLRRRTEFADTIRGGRRAARGPLVVHLVVPSEPDPAAPSSADAPPAAPLPVRVGLVVPRAVGGAVIRNRVKRRLRHLVRERLPSLPPGAKLVVRALPGAARREYADLGADLDGALARVTTARRR
jgi:ribonuclease P protein component